MMHRESGGVSRREFLRNSGILAGAAALAGSGLAMGGCASASGKDEPTQKAPVSYEVYETDVLVIGGGTGGVFAALQTYKENSRVMLVDKGPFKYSGATGMNWDAGSGTGTPAVPDPQEQAGTWSDPLTNKKLSAKAIEFIGKNAEAWNRPLTFCRMGNTTFWRNDVGELAIPSNEQTFMRCTPEYLDANTTIPVVDNTMITGVFVSGGSCAGAIGLHVPTGTYRVFRAKATVIANGGCTQMYGWSGTGALSINVPDNTGDVDMAAYRQGCSLINPEFFSYDLISLWPPAIGGSFASGIGADSVSKNLVCDKDGDFFLADETYVGYQPITTATAKRILEGKGSPNGCVYLDLSSPEASVLTRPAYYRNVALWKEIFGIDVTLPENKVEIGVEAFEHMCTPVADENMMTEIPGLFNVRDAGNMLMLHSNHYLAGYAGKCAADYAESLGDEAEVDWSCAEEEIARLEDVLNAEGTIRPHVIRHNIQNAVYEALHLGSNSGKLEAAIAEIERIRDEEIPQMAVSNKTRCLNYEWCSAIENLNLIAMSEATPKATLMREESRLFFFRPDFPEADDENWLVNILAKQSENGVELVTRNIVGL